MPTNRLSIFVIEDNAQMAEMTKDHIQEKFNNTEDDAVEPEDDIAADVNPDLKVK